MDCYLVDILYLSEAFGGARIGNCDIKPTDGAGIMPEQGSKIMLTYGHWGDDDYFLFLLGKSSI